MGRRGHGAVDVRLDGRLLDAGEEVWGDVEPELYGLGGGVGAFLPSPEEAVVRAAQARLDAADRRSAASG